jgi:hypothetical protein
MAAVALVEASAACVGSLISTSIMYPLEVTKTKVQAFGGRSKTATQDGSASEQTKAMNTMVGALRYTWKTEGYNGLFPPFAPGWIPKLVDAGTFNFIFWFWFTICTAISRRIGQGFWIDTVTGIVAAVINRLCTHPFENIAQRIQTRLPGQPLEGFFSAGGNICRASHRRWCSALTPRSTWWSSSASAAPTCAGPLPGSGVLSSTLLPWLPSSSPWRRSPSPR